MSPAQVAPAGQHLLAAHGDLPLCVGNRQFQLFDPLQKHAVAAARVEFHPAGRVFAVVVPGERRIRSLIFTRRPVVRPAGQDARFHQHLEPVADAQYEFVLLQKVADLLREVSAKLGAEDHSGADVVAVAEPAGNAQHLVLAQPRRIFEQAKQVDPLGRRPALFERERGLDVAIGSGGTQNANVGSRHEIECGKR
jgi:hypothetical protein